MIVVSSRLPVTVSKINGKISFKSSAGGLATGLSSVVKKNNMLWIGWPGIASDDLTIKEQAEITKSLAEKNCVPVFLTQEQIDLYYSGYCNSTLWPLFHYFLQRSEHSDKYWQAYEKVNKIFAKTVAKHSSVSQKIWVQDYQLMLLPELIRKKIGKAKIGFFLHTPFPSYEIFRLLPERERLLNGLLGADLIGFHTYDYVRHFLGSALRTLGQESNLGEISLKEQNRVVQVDSFPIGIDYERYANSSKPRSAKAAVRRLAEINSDSKLVLSIDRADYSKGIPERLDAIEQFLIENPEAHGKVNFLMLAVPSRENVEAYKELVQEIEQKVSHLNGKYGQVGWMPVSYLNQSVSFEELGALYNLADVMLVTPLRDGMNLVCKEYIAAKRRKPGVLVLSELAGAASELLEVIKVNPYDMYSTARGIKQALEMPVKEQRQRMKAMQKRVSTYNIQKWAKDFVDQLSDKPDKNKDSKQLDKNYSKSIIDDYKNATSRLFLLDYDGTLKDFVNTPEEAKAKPDDELIRLLKKLASDKKNKVVIISGRRKIALKRWFKAIPVELVAEHGGWVRQIDKWQKTVFKASSWKKQLVPVLEKYTEKTPSSVLEVKDFSLVWHYRKVAPELAYVRKEEIKNELEHMVGKLGVEIHEGNKVLEVKPSGLNKGTITQRLFAEHDWDFVLCAGDDYTDEDMFKALPESSKIHTIKVGSSATSAKRMVFSVKQFKEFLESLT